MRFEILRRGTYLLLAVLVLCGAVHTDAAARQVPRGAAQVNPVAEKKITSVRLHWKPFAGAVRYAVRIMRGSPSAGMKEVALLRRV